MDHWFSDIRRSLRSLVRAPAFSLAVIVTTALGIATATAVYSLDLRDSAQAVSLSDPERLPATDAIVGAVLCATGLLAAWIPAHRASRVDPIRALRSE
jgi:ABC-type antimicrobial peptide transport system permease subunit